LDSSRSPGRAEDGSPPSWPHPPSAPCTDASQRAPLSTAVDIRAGAVFGPGVVRGVCAQTAAPATTATDMTTASDLIRSPFADSCAFFGRCTRVSGCVTAQKDTRDRNDVPAVCALQHSERMDQEILQRQVEMARREWVADVRDRPGWRYRGTAFFRMYSST